jgi:tetratricopeptide (TPR) repeat protein
MNDLNLSYPVLIDNNRNAYAQFEVKAIPTTIILNKKGEIAARIPSYTIAFYDQVEAQLSYLLGKINLNELQNVMNSKNETAEIDEKLERTLSLANNLYRRGFYDSAMDYYEETLTMSPDLTDAHLGRGTILLKRNKIDMAKSEFQTVLKLTPDNPAALKGMAQINLFKGSIATAEELLNKVISANYIDEDLYYILGQVYEKQGKLQEALNAYKKNCENLLRKKRFK